MKKTTNYENDYISFRDELEGSSYSHQKLHSNYFFHIRILVLLGICSLGFLIRNILVFFAEDTFAYLYFALYLTGALTCAVSLPLLPLCHKKRKNLITNRIIVLSSAILFYLLVLLSLFDSLYIGEFDYTAYTFGLLLIGFILRLEKRTFVLILVIGFGIFMSLYKIFDITGQSALFPLLAINLLAFYFSSAKETYFIRLHRDNRELKDKSSRDGLTGVFNRDHMNKLLPWKIEQSQKHGGPFSLIFTDIDDFKEINDTYGHTVGDKVLIDFSRILGDESRSSDTVIRYGGEEFLIILPGIDGGKALPIAERIRTTTEQNNFDGFPEKVTASFGVTEVRPDDNAESLLKRADELLYLAKGSGKNRCCSGREPAI